jgi:hypothetical protein
MYSTLCALLVHYYRWCLLSRGCKHKNLRSRGSIG